MDTKLSQGYVSSTLWIPADVLLVSLLFLQAQESRASYMKMLETNSQRSTRKNLQTILFSIR
jgi:hypothetical protein